MRLTFAAQYRESATQYPELQVWRNMSGTFVKVGNTDNMEPVQTAYLNVYEYVPNVPLQFQANDLLGVFQPPSTDTQAVVYYQVGGGPRNYARSN